MSHAALNCAYCGAPGPVRAGRCASCVQAAYSVRRVLRRRLDALTGSGDFQAARVLQGALLLAVSGPLSKGRGRRRGTRS